MNSLKAKLMDNASFNVTLFLEALQDSWTALADISNVWRRWVPIAKPYVSAPSGRPFTLWEKGTKRIFKGCAVMGIHVQLQPLDEKSIEFEITVIWDDEQWYIRTEVGDYSPEEGLKTIRSFPERRTGNLNECIQCIQSAVKDLATCGDIVLDRVRETG
jgi:hypothetical protein